MQNLSELPEGFPELLLVDAVGQVADMDRVSRLLATAVTLLLVVTPLDCQAFWLVSALVRHLLALSISLVVPAATPVVTMRQAPVPAPAPVPSAPLATIWGPASSALLPTIAIELLVALQGWHGMVFCILQKPV